MKILYISPENTVGTLSAWKRFHESKGNTCDFITFYKTPNNFEPGICLDLPLVSTGGFYRKLRSIYYYNKYGVNGEYSIKCGYPPTWRASKNYEQIFFSIRDYIWKKTIRKKLKHIDLLSYDIYHFEWGLDFFRDCSFAKKIAKLNKPIFCTYHGQDLRTRGVIEPLNTLSDVNLTSEVDLLSMHPKMDYMFLPVRMSPGLSIKKTSPKIKACHSPTNRYYKGSDKIIDICKRISQQNKCFEFILIENLSNKEVLKIKSSCDIVIDQIGNCGGWGYGMNSVESMNLGLCCLTEMNQQCDNFYKNHPFVGVDENTLEKKLTFLINNPKTIDDYKQKSLDWVRKNHDIAVVGQKLYDYYKQLL